MARDLPVPTKASKPIYGNAVSQPEDEFHLILNKQSPFTGLAQKSDPGEIIANPTITGGWVDFRTGRRFSYSAKLPKGGNSHMGLLLDYGQFTRCNRGIGWPSEEEPMVLCNIPQANQPSSYSSI